MFPNGLRALSDKVGPLVQHMGKWTGTAPDSSRKSAWKKPPPYALTNPGEWIVEPGGSLPTGVAFWDALWRNASQWGLQTFKLDHVQETIPHMNYTSRDVNAVESWLTLMTESAYKHGIYKEYGGHYSGGVLHSVTLMGATVARVSADYIPGVLRPNGSCDHLPPVAQQLRVTARGNVLLAANTLYPWAIGLLPYRDAFMSANQDWATTTCLQGNTGPESTSTSLKPEWFGLQEGLPELQALVAALSAGPIAPGDGIGDTDVDLVLRTCRSDGILLKPERPIFPIVSWWVGNALGSGDGPTPRGAALNTHSGSAEVGYTYTELNGLRWYFVLGVGLDKAFHLTPSDVRSELAPAHNVSLAHCQWGWECRARGCRRIQADQGNVTLTPFSEEQPIVLPPYDSPHGVGWGHFRFVRTVPVLCNGWLLLGEADKFISVSRSRILNLVVDCSAGMVVQVGGALGEVVTMLLRPPPADGGNAAPVIVRSCTVGTTGRCSIVVPGSHATLKTDDDPSSTFNPYPVLWNSNCELKKGLGHHLVYSSCPDRALLRTAIDPAALAAAGILPREKRIRNWSAHDSPKRWCTEPVTTGGSGSACLRGQWPLITSTGIINGGVPQAVSGDHKLPVVKRSIAVFLSHF
jgi:hypothetical protein